MPCSVRPEGEISRFIREPDEVFAATSAIKPRRLIPTRNTKTGRLELSVCRTSGMASTEIWAICAANFDAMQRHPAIGRCAANEAVVYGASLDIDTDGKPYPQHANIVGWHDVPGQPEKEIKHLWKNQILLMAPHFKFIARN
jgi:hypothetical protein